MKNLYLYGSGKRCRILLRVLQGSDYQICGIIDSDPNKWNTALEGIKVQKPEILYDKKNVWVCVTFYSSLMEDPIWKWLESEYHIEKNHIMTFHSMLFERYRKQFVSMNKPEVKERKFVFFDATWGLGLGGVETWLKDMMRYFQRDKDQKKDVYLLTKKNQEEIPEEVRECIMEFYYEDTSQFLKQDISRGIEFIKQHAPCTLVFSRVNELLLAASICKVEFPMLFKIIMVDHGLCDGMTRDILSYREAIDHYVCVGTGIRQALIDEGIKREQIDIMTIQIEPEKQMDRAYQIHEGDPIRLGYAGRLEVFQKRLDLLLRLILELERRNVYYCLRIAGAGSFEEDIRWFVKNNHLESKITLYGQINREKMAEFWKEQDVAINVSDHEGRPISNMEAMLYGAVPVVTNTVGIRDDVEDGRNGYIVPVNDYVAMADRIEYLDRHREILPLFGKRAQMDIQKKMNLNDYMKFWLSIIE